MCIRYRWSRSHSRILDLNKKLKNNKRFRIRNLNTESKTLLQISDFKNTAQQSNKGFFQLQSCFGLRWIVTLIQSRLRISVFKMKLSFLDHILADIYTTGQKFKSTP